MLVVALAPANAYSTESEPAASPAATVSPAALAPLSYVATWYCNADRARGRPSTCRQGYPDRPGVADLFAAVTPDMAHLRGKLLTVWLGSKHVTVLVVDQCDCGTKHVDLYADAFVELVGSLRPGRVSVRVSE